jgi:hypothetical protein
MFVLRKARQIGMSRKERLGGWMALVAMVGLILESGWLVTTTMRQIAFVWLAVAAAIIIIAYCGWTKWTRRAEDRGRYDHDHGLS